MNHKFTSFLCLILLILSIDISMADEGERIHMNRLAQEKSPYLLQHADNPVDWYPWGEEAFKKAESENKPIFLSIGYSTCHWCHVMEHESFEDESIARIINMYFVPIKVDREERPDIDQIYMSAVQAMTGQGGWPLNLFLTPERKPFFGGTYFPPEQRWGSPGFKDVLFSIRDSWEQNREKIEASGDQIVAMISANLPGKHSSQYLDESIFNTAYGHFARNYDAAYGGFGSAPKFPSSHNLSFLLREWYETGENQALKMTEVTLRKMAGGGMFDHLGGGFHRYSTDQQWQIPHFEKMLYDQGMLAQTYLDMYQVTGDDFFAQVAREILDYVMRDMTHPGGGFYSAEDADSIDPYDNKVEQSLVGHNRKKKEGAYFLWTVGEVDKLLTKHADIFKFYYGFKDHGNAFHDPHNEFNGKNIIYQAKSLEETEKEFRLSGKEIKNILKNCRAILFKERIKRPRPHLDDKILTDWNGLMISAFAVGAEVLNEPGYKEAAKGAAKFILKKLLIEGNLLHRYRDGESGITGTLEDYAFFSNGLLDLYQSTHDVEYLQHAHKLALDMLENFWDDVKGGFYLTSDGAEKLIVRPKEIYDGAYPSGNSMAAMVLARLYHFTLDEIWSGKIEELFNAFSKDIQARPFVFSQLLNAYRYMSKSTYEIVIAQNENERIDHLIRGIHKEFIPNKVIIIRKGNEKDTAHLVKLSPFVADQRPLKGKTTIYVCQNHVCQLPVYDLKNMMKLLKEDRIK